MWTTFFPPYIVIWHHLRFLVGGHHATDPQNGKLFLLRITASTRETGHGDLLAKGSVLGETPQRIVAVYAEHPRGRLVVGVRWQGPAQLGENERVEEAGVRERTKTVRGDGVTGTVRKILGIYLSKFRLRFRLFNSA